MIVISVSPLISREVGYFASPTFCTCPSRNLYCDTKAIVCVVFILASILPVIAL